MSHEVKNALRSKLVPLLALPLAACLQVSEAQPPSQWTFASAEEASRALFVAVQGHDSSAMKEILGTNDELISSSDDAQDRLDRDQFVGKYRQMHRLASAGDREMVLYVGAENWPFPIPLVLHDGVWRYDSDAGVQEVMYRRIGENEVTAIEACQVMVVTLKQPVARAEQKPLASRGYMFRILSSRGNSKLELVAYPVVYGSTGVMTFIVNDAGVVYEKDLGTGTKTLVTKMATVPTDSTWTRLDTGLANAD